MAHEESRRTIAGLRTALKIRRKQLIGGLKLRRRSEQQAINRVEYRVFSQHREDGIIDHLLNSVGVDRGNFVEFGFGPHVCNCLNLMVNRHFSGLFMDGSAENCALARSAYRWLGKTDVKIVHSFLTRDNLNSAIADSGTTGSVDVLSIDVDGNDYWFWSDLNAIDPRIVVIEYNASFGRDRSVTVPYDPGFVRYEKHDSGFYHGASLRALERLGKTKGYRLVGVDATGVNAFFLRNDLQAKDIETLSARQAFRPHRGRVKYKGVSQEEQFERIKDMPFVEIE